MQSKNLNLLKKIKLTLYDEYMMIYEKIYECSYGIKININFKMLFGKKFQFSFILEFYRKSVD